MYSKCLSKISKQVHSKGCMQIHSFISYYQYAYLQKYWNMAYGKKSRTCKLKLDKVQQNLPKA